MMPSLLRARQAMAWVAVACAALLTAACGSIGAPGAGPTATVTVTPTQAGTPAAGTSSAGTPAAGTPSAGTPAAAATPGPCGTAGLRVTLGQESAGAGHFYRTLVFTNISGSSCTLFGYPGVSFVTGAGGQQIGAAAGRSPAGKRLIVLGPGKQAHAVVDLLDVLNFPSSKCAATNAHWLKVYPPNQFSATYVRWTAMVCSNSGTVYLSVAPVRPGA